MLLNRHSLGPQTWPVGLFLFPRIPLDRDGFVGSVCAEAAFLHYFFPSLSLSLSFCAFQCVCARMLKLDLSCPCCSHHSLPSPKTVSFAQRRATPSLSGKHLFLFNKLCPTETRGSAHFALIGRAGSRQRCDEEEERERERERVSGGREDRPGSVSPGGTGWLMKAKMLFSRCFSQICLLQICCDSWQTEFILTKSPVS